MAHEITQHDNVVLHRTPAWHGLGVVVQDAPTPMEALKIAGLDWNVEQWPMSATNGETRLMVDDQLNVRMPGAIKLGIVGQHYKVVQNVELAQFCQDLAEQNDTVRVESAGSIREGRKVWFLLKGESFSVRSSDEVVPYICVSNGHDGGTAIRATPTTVRVVCSNTLHMVIPDNERELSSRIKPTAFQISHVGDPRKRIEEAKMVLGLYGRTLDTTREFIDQLAAKDVSRESVKRFWLEAYTRTIGPIADVPATATEKKARETALEAMNWVSGRFEQELDLAGATAWNAANAFTAWLQHGKESRLKDPTKIQDQKLGSNMFGTAQDKTILTMQMAMSI